MTTLAPVCAISSAARLELRAMVPADQRAPNPSETACPAAQPTPQTRANAHPSACARRTGRSACRRRFPWRTLARSTAPGGPRAQTRRADERALRTPRLFLQHQDVRDAPVVHVTHELGVLRKRQRLASPAHCGADRGDSHHGRADAHKLADAGKRLPARVAEARRVSGSGTGCGAAADLGRHGMVSCSGGLAKNWSSFSS
jgi:hypothetical protein